MKNSVDLLDALHRNGVITERARRAGQSLTQVERNVIFANRLFASEHGHSKTMIIAGEQEGQRDFSLVKSPIKVVAKFAYYHDGFEEVPPIASYLILESNHPSLPVMGNVEAKMLTDAGIKVPSTPTFEKWVKDGRKCFRGVQS